MNSPKGQEGRSKFLPNTCFVCGKEAWTGFLCFSCRTSKVVKNGGGSS